MPGILRSNNSASGASAATLSQTPLCRRERTQLETRALELTAHDLAEALVVIDEHDASAGHGHF
jgi:hypothetical protein